jgi:soluble lytic murein transglycosylase-like protein
MVPAQAAAQIYAWRDARGTLVLSDRMIDAPTAIHEVSGAPHYRVTRPVESGTFLARFEPLVVEHASRHAIRPELVRAVIQVESGFNPFARSPKGAMGLMQLMPRTAQELGVGDPYDPAQNIRGGTAYLRQLLNRYDGNEELALAAYNAGAGAVDRHGRSVPPFRETRDYVKRVVGSAGSSSTPIRPTLVIYKSIDIIDGRAVPRYSSAAPPAGTFERIER